MLYKIEIHMFNGRGGEWRSRLEHSLRMRTTWSSYPSRDRP